MKKPNATLVRENKVRRHAIANGFYLVKANRADIWFLMDGAMRKPTAQVFYSLDEVEQYLDADTEDEIAA